MMKIPLNLEVLNQSIKRVMGAEQAPPKIPIDQNILNQAITNVFSQPTVADTAKAPITTSPQGRELAAQEQRRRDNIKKYGVAEPVGDTLSAAPKKGTIRKAIDYFTEPTKFKAGETTPYPQFKRDVEKKGEVFLEALFSVPPFNVISAGLQGIRMASQAHHPGQGDRRPRTDIPVVVLAEILRSMSKIAELFSGNETELVKAGEYIKKQYPKGYPELAKKTQPEWFQKQYPAESEILAQFVGNGAEFLAYFGNYKALSETLAKGGPAAKATITIGIDLIENLIKEGRMLEAKKVINAFNDVQKSIAGKMIVGEVTPRKLIQGGGEFGKVKETPQVKKGLESIAGGHIPETGLATPGRISERGPLQIREKGQPELFNVRPEGSKITQEQEKKLKDFFKTNPRNQLPPILGSKITTPENLSLFGSKTKVEGLPPIPTIKPFIDKEINVLEGFLSSRGKQLPDIRATRDRYKTPEAYKDFLKREVSKVAIPDKYTGELFSGGMGGKSLSKTASQAKPSAELFGGERGKKLEGEMPKYEVLKFEDITIKPEILQPRDVDMKTGVDPEKVRTIAENFDWNKFESPKVIPDPANPGKYLLYDGHHTLEAMRQNGITEAPINIRNISIQQAQELAVTMGVSREPLKALDAGKKFRVLADKGKTLDEIKKEYSVAYGTGNIQRQIDLTYLSPQLQDMVKIKSLPVPHAAVIGKAARLNPEIFNPTVQSEIVIEFLAKEKGITPNILDNLIERLKPAMAQQIDLGFGITEVKGFIRALSELNKKVQQIGLKRKRLNGFLKEIVKAQKAKLEVPEAYRKAADQARNDISALQKQIDTLQREGLRELTAKPSIPEIPKIEQPAEKVWTKTLNNFIEERKGTALGNDIFALKNIHREEVKNAYLRGEYIPDEVLREYPELKVTPTQEIPTIEKPPESLPVVAQPPAEPPKPPVPVAAPTPPAPEPEPIKVIQQMPDIKITRDGDKIITEYKKNISFGRKKEGLTFGKVKETAKKTLQDLYTSVVDRFNPIVKLAREGGKLPAGVDPELLVNRYLGVRGLAEVKIFYYTHTIDETGKQIKTGIGLKQATEPMKDHLQDLSIYMSALSDIDQSRALSVAKKPIIGTRAEESAQLIKVLEDKYGEIIKQTAKEVNEWNIRANLDPLVEVEWLTKAGKEAMLRKYPHYAPSNRVMDDLERSGAIPASKGVFQPKGRPIKGLVGSKRAKVDPLEQFIANTYRITDFVERRRVAKAIVNLKNIYPEKYSKIIKEVPAKWFPVADVEMRAQIDADFIKEIGNFAKSLGLSDLKTGGQIKRSFGHYTPAWKEVVRQFTSGRETTSHEIGHFLDDMFSLKNRFYARFRLTPAERAVGKKGFWGEENPVAIEMIEFMKKMGESKGRIKMPAERFADAFEWWMVHRDLAKADLPLFSNEMERIINSTPELKPLLNIKPSPKSVVERMNKKIFARSSFAPAPNTIFDFKNGVKKWYTVPEDVFKVVNGMTSAEAGMLEKIMRIPARTLRAGATLTMEFIGRNPIRDQWTAFINSKYGYNPLIDLPKGIWSLIRRDDMYQRWMASGAAQAMLVSMDRTQSIKKLKDLHGSKVLRELTIATNPFEALRVLGEFGEQGTRIGAFRKALKVGRTEEEAMMEARDITLNFARHGSQTRFLKSTIAFFNPNIQGLDKMQRAMRERPLATTLKAVASITIPSIGLYIINRNDPRYRELPYWQKNLFWIVIPKTISRQKWDAMTEGERIKWRAKYPIIRMPKPFDYGIPFGSLPERILEYIDTQDPNALSELAKNALESSTPGWILTAVLPIIENQTNYNFFRDQPIVPRGKERLPPGFQSSTYNSETLKRIGMQLNISPAKIENLIAEWSGGLGKHSLDLIDYILESGGVLKPVAKPSKTGADKPFIKAFRAREPIGSNSQSVNRVYQLYDENSKEMNAVRELIKTQGLPAAKEYLLKNPDALKASVLNTTIVLFSQLRQRKESILNSRTMTPDQKKDQIDRIDSMMTDISYKVLQKLKKPINLQPRKIEINHELLQESIRRVIGE